MTSRKEERNLGDSKWDHHAPPTLDGNPTRKKVKAEPPLTTESPWMNRKRLAFASPSEMPRTGDTCSPPPATRTLCTPFSPRQQAPEIGTHEWGGNRGYRADSSKKLHISAIDLLNALLDLGIMPEADNPAKWSNPTDNKTVTTILDTNSEWRRLIINYYKSTSNVHFQGPELVAAAASL
jgi:hypothetical protein